MVGGVGWWGALSLCRTAGLADRAAKEGGSLSELVSKCLAEQMEYLGGSSNFSSPTIRGQV